MDDAGWPGVELADAPLAGLKQLERVHSPAHVERIERFCASGGGMIDADTVAVEASWEAALRAAGAASQASERLLEGEHPFGDDVGSRWSLFPTRYGGLIYYSSSRSLVAVESFTDETAWRTPPNMLAWQTVVKGRVYGMTAANGRLFLSTDDGSILCYASN